MPPRPRRRAVGPVGAVVPQAPPDLLPTSEQSRGPERSQGMDPESADDDERLLADRPPHHDRAG